MEKKIICAPVLIPTLCRSEHFIRCIESLKKNKWAKYTDIYVALDYPKSEKHWEGYCKICKYLDGSFNEFANFYIIKRPYNYGSGKNMIDLRKRILKRYDRFIRTDDDCEFSPCFLEYMNKCLEMYKEDPEVLGVTGYTYPIEWDISSNANAFKSITNFPMWGTGFWRDKFLKMEQEIHSGYIRNKWLNDEIKKGNMSDARYLDALNINAMKEEITLLDIISDVSCGCYMQISNSRIIMPKKSLVRNYGFDGSGVYCQNIESYKNYDAHTYNYAEQEIMKDLIIDVCVDENINFTKNMDLINEFDNRNKIDIVKSYIKYKVKRLLMIFR